ncbi:ankyrin repeat domain-containing protein [Thermopolyspora sp. NPDC052614]|uniref:ankyrin repeat domain-containing protein n=1 Tax=Thermopolyspora sp. NPDC052614 TaxID=3155682 RepID=UPI00342E44C5
MGGHIDFSAVAEVVRRGDLAALAGLVASGRPVDEDDGVTGTTALLVACESGQTEIAEFLLARGADPNRVHRDGWNCYDSTKAPAIRELLVRHGFALTLWQPTRGAALEQLRVLSPARPLTESWSGTLTGTAPTLEYRAYPQMSGSVFMSVTAAGHTRSYAVTTPGHLAAALPGRAEPGPATLRLRLEGFRGEFRVRLYCADRVPGDGLRDFWLPDWTG